MSIFLLEYQYILHILQLYQCMPLTTLTLEFMSELEILIDLHHTLEAIWK